MVPMGFGLADQEDNELNNNSVETAMIVKIRLMLLKKIV